LARTDSKIDEGLYSAETTRRCYSRLAELAESVLRAGFTVVVDAAFLERNQRNVLSQTADRLRVPFRIVHVHADEATLCRRLVGRKASGSDASEAGLAVLRHQLQAREPLGEDERQASLGIDTAEAHWQEHLVAAVQAW
jgi:predicted kinase